MARLKWAIPCFVASIDRFTNAITLTHIIDEIGLPESVAEGSEIVPTKPMLVQPGFTFVTLWERNAEKAPEDRFHVRLSFLGPTRKAVTKVEFTIDLTVATRARNLSRFGHLPFVGFGEYVFQLHTRTGENNKWKKAGALPMRIKPTDFAQVRT